MRRYENKEKINETTFSTNVPIRCSIGGNYCRSKVEVKIEHGNWYLDFDDIREYFASLNGANFSQEELCAAVFEKMQKEYEPKAITVNVYEDTDPVSVITRRG